jgi:hypothetical protein
MLVRNMHKRLVSLIVTSLLVEIIISVILLSAAVHADDPNRVGLVARFGNGNVFTKCVEFDEDQISGLEVLLRSGLNVIYEQSGAGAAVCKIGDDGCDYPLEHCFCQCLGGANCVYWSYWHLKEEAWQYSLAGASGYFVRDGDVEGWAWGPGTSGSGPEPPVIEFNDICAPPPTATPSSTAKPTDTPLPTDTPVPPTPVVAFTVQPATITAGDCAELRWDVEHAQAVYLDGRGVVGHQVEQVCPTQAQTYELRVISAAGEFHHQVTLNVLQPSPTPVPTDTVTPIPTHTPTPTATTVLSATVVPTATSLPTITPAPTDTATPVPTSMPLVTTTLSTPPLDVPSVSPTPKAQVHPSSSAFVAARKVLEWPVFIGLLALLIIIYLRCQLSKKK